MTRGPAPDRDLQCGAYEIADRLKRLKGRDAMIRKVADIGGAENLKLELVSTRGRYKLFGFNRTRVLGNTRAAMDAKSPWQYSSWVRPGAPSPLAFNKSKLVG